jgi:uncharacterized membrane protein
MESTAVAFVLTAVVGSGLMGGLLFAFSNFVMRALLALPPEYAVAAMREVNQKILNPLFLVLFLGNSLTCVSVIWLAVSSVAGPASPWLICGSVAYLAGPVGVTMLFNVPLNNRLAVGPNETAAKFWPTYAMSWTRWNHVRTVLSVVAATLLSAGLGKL